MVRVIYVTKNKDFQHPAPKISSLEDYFKENDEEDSGDYETSFELTGNMDNLGYWSVDRDLLGKTAPEVAKKIRKILRELGDQGYKVGVPDEDNDNWMWGHQKGDGWFVDGNRDLSRYERVEVLMWWLSAVLDIIDEYDDTHYLV